MKTHKRLFVQVCTFDTLWNAFHQARRGKGGKAEVAAFEYQLERNLLGLERERRERTFGPRMARRTANGAKDVWTANGAKDGECRERETVQGCVNGTYPRGCGRFRGGSRSFAASWSKGLGVQAG